MKTILAQILKVAFKAVGLTKEDTLLVMGSRNGRFAYIAYATEELDGCGFW